jgi:beta-glucosidase
MVKILIFVDMKRIAILTTALCLAACTAGEPLYKNPDASVEKRVEDLLKRMTLEEKVGQMNQYTGLAHIRKTEERRNKGKDLSKSDSYSFYKDFPADTLEAWTRRGLVGSFLHVYTLEEANHLQELAMSSRLGIPIIFGIDAVHGNAFCPDNTIYPTAIGLASTFDRDLVGQISRQTALEMRSMNMHWTFAPGVDISRDPRWGRCGETFGEDPYLVGEMGVASVRGLQGELGPTGVLTTIKHLVGGGQSVNGANAGPTDISEQTLEDIFLPPYKKAVEAGALGLMPAHNDINGIPCHGNKPLIEGRVRGQWGFSGIVVSDWMDVERMATGHKYAEDRKDAYAKAIDAGLDIHMHGPEWQKDVCELVREGRVSEKRIDASVRRILALKFRLGLFEQPFADSAKTFEVRLNPEHRETALKAARESIVLLKNDGILPLDPARYRRVLVTGINSDSHNIDGDWSAIPRPENVTTILEGLREVSPGTQFVWSEQGLSPGDMKPEYIEDAARKARGCDLVIFVGGDFMNRDLGGLTGGENHDRADISLPGLQNELFERLAAAGKPIVTVVVSGRPLGVERQDAASRAVLNAWEPGMYGGQALAEILYGKVNPSGKLAMTMIRNSYQTVLTYNHKPMHYFHRYIDQPSDPLYPFGHGLSYTEFKYSHLTLSDDAIGPDGQLTVSVDVSNSGKLPGDEVVQLYITDLVSSRTRPVKELKGFERVSLEPGQTRTVTFSLAPEDLAFFSGAGRHEAEKGEFKVWVGPSSADKTLLTKKFNLI